MSYNMRYMKSAEAFTHDHFEGKNIEPILKYACDQIHKTALTLL